MPANRPFFDSNVLLYTIDRADVRRSVVHSLVSEGGVISVQCLNEFARVAHRKLGMGWPQVEEARDQLLAFCDPVLPLTIELHRTGVRLAALLRLSVFDAMIVAAALEADCDTLYSEDMHHGLVIDGRLRIENPFRG